jgi:hypothetical protein
MSKLTTNISTTTTVMSMPPPLRTSTESNGYTGTYDSETLDVRDSESASEDGLEDNIDVEEDELDDHEEQEQDDSAMQVESRTDEHNIPKDPSSNPKKKVTSFLTAVHKA